MLLAREGEVSGVFFLDKIVIHVLVQCCIMINSDITRDCITGVDHGEISVAINHTEQGLTNEEMYYVYEGFPLLLKSWGHVSWLLHSKWKNGWGTDAERTALLRNKRNT